MRSVRTVRLKSRVKSRTTGMAKRAVRRRIVPTYGKKGIGCIKNPEKALKNKVYHATTVSMDDLIGTATSGSKSRMMESLSGKAVDTSELKTSEDVRTLTKDDIADLKKQQKNVNCNLVIGLLDIILGFIAMVSVPGFALVSILGMVIVLLAIPAKRNVRIRLKAAERMMLTMEKEE